MKNEKMNRSIDRQTARHHQYHTRIERENGQRMHRSNQRNARISKVLICIVREYGSDDANRPSMDPLVKNALERLAAMDVVSIPCPGTYVYADKKYYVART